MNCMPLQQALKTVAHFQFQSQHSKRSEVTRAPSDRHMNSEDHEHKESHKENENLHFCNAHAPEAPNRRHPHIFTRYNSHATTHMLQLTCRHQPHAATQTAVKTHCKDSCKEPTIASPEEARPFSRIGQSNQSQISRVLDLPMLRRPGAHHKQTTRSTRRSSQIGPKKIHLRFITNRLTSGRFHTKQTSHQADSSQADSPQTDSPQTDFTQEDSTAIGPKHRRHRRPRHTAHAPRFLFF